MDDMRLLEEVVRRIAREEITRALGAAGAAAKGVWDEAPADSAEESAANVLRRTMARVALDVVRNAHPALDREHSDQHAPDDACTCGHDFYRHREGACFACSCPGFQPGTVHTVTAVPEPVHAACTCHRHAHVMAHENHCGFPGCFCRTPVRAHVPGQRAQDVHAGHTVLGGRCLTCTDSTCPACGHVRHVGQPCLETDTGCRCWEHQPDAEPEGYLRPCTVCEHGEHDQGKCGMHVYVRGVARPCPCLASRTVGSERARTDEHASTATCTYCEHDVHGAVEGCGAVIWPATDPCSCRNEPPTLARAINGQCKSCTHAVHVGGECTQEVPYGGGSMRCACRNEPPCECTRGLARAINGQCQGCGHKAHSAARCSGKRSFQ